MQVWRAKEMLRELDDSDEIFFAIETKSEVEENYLAEATSDPKAEFTKEEWLEVINRLDKDDALWSDLIESITYAVEKILEDRDDTQKG